MIVDLHVKLETEDGSLVDPAVLAEGAKAAGLDAMLLTQEGVLQPDISAYQAAAEAEGLVAFAGAKLVTNHGQLLCIFPGGTTLGEDWTQAEGEVFDADALVDSIEALGGVSIALRPYDRELDHPMGDYLFSLQGLTACEVLNASLSETANDLALEAASNLGMPCVAASGAQGTAGLGSAATLLRDPVGSETQLCELIRGNDCWPVRMSEEAPEIEEPRRDGRGRRGERRGGNDRRGGGDRRGERSGGERGRRRNRRGRGRGARPDDVGNRAPGGQRVLAEDAGNRVTPEGSLPAEDIGNRLAPGEVSPYQPQPEPDYED